MMNIFCNILQLKILQNAIASHLTIIRTIAAVISILIFEAVKNIFAMNFSLISITPYFVLFYYHFFFFLR